MDTHGTQAFTKFCPACQKGNDANSVTCRYCGASLDLIASKADVKETQFARGYSNPASGVAFYLSGTTTQIGVADNKEFILGRKAEGDTDPLVDLTNLDGFDMGVSRRHAKIRSGKHGYEIIDLNSSNGTWLNGKILMPAQSYDLPNGGLIQLGRLKLVAIFNPPAKEKK